MVSPRALGTLADAPRLGSGAELGILLGCLLQRLSRQHGINGLAPGHSARLVTHGVSEHAASGGHDKVNAMLLDQHLG